MEEEEEGEEEEEKEEEDDEGTGRSVGEVVMWYNLHNCVWFECGILLRSSPADARVRARFHGSPRPHRLARPRTQPFQGCYAGSNPAGDAMAS